MPPPVSVKSDTLDLIARWMLNIHPYLVRHVFVKVFPSYFKCKSLYPDADVALELPSGHFLLEHLVNFLQSSVASLGKEEPGEGREDHVRPKPDIPILCRPSETRRIDEVGCCKSAQPVTKEVQCGGETKYIATKPVIWVLSPE